INFPCMFSGGFSLAEMSCVQVAAFSRNKRKRQWQSRPLPIIESLTPYHVTDCQKYPIMGNSEWREWLEKPIVPTKAQGRTTPREAPARRAVVPGSYLVNWCGLAGMEIGGVAWICEDFD